MIPIYPLTIEAITPHIGRPVLAVLQDGQEHAGILSRVQGRSLTLNDEPSAASLRKNGGTIKGTKSKQAKTLAQKDRTGRRSAAKGANRILPDGDKLTAPFADPFAGNFVDPFPNLFEPMLPPEPPELRVSIPIKNLSALYLLTF